MSQNIKTILIVLITMAVFILANVLAGRRMKKAADFIIRDLKEKQAFDPASAVTLPYSKGSAFRIGLKDYRSGALQQLVKYEVIRQEGDKYYLRDKDQKIFNP